MLQSVSEVIAHPVQPLPRSVSSFIDRSLAVQPLNANPVNANPGLAALPEGAAFPRARFVLWLAALTVMVGMMAASYLAYTASVSTSSYNLQRLMAEREAWRV